MDDKTNIIDKNHIILPCQIEVGAFDWGPAIQKIHLLLPQSLGIQEIDSSWFQVLINHHGVKTEVNIEYAKVLQDKIVIGFQSHPSFQHLLVFQYDSEKRVHRFRENVTIEVLLSKPIRIGDINYDGIEIAQISDYLIPSIEGVRYGTSAFDSQICLHYGLFLPEESGQIPLIIWLHGAGEGGEDPRIVLLGNPVTRLMEAKVQNAFGKAAVLFPQAPTFWMDDGSHQYTKDGKSMYTKALMSLIQKTVSENPSIDPNRVYLGGCSNGGFMTVLLLKEYPGYFAGAFPICEAYLDSWLSDEDILKLSKTPIWFTSAQNDPILPVEQFTLPTYKRLVSQNQKEVQLSLFPDVKDGSGQYLDGSGKPFQYHGHFSWIYTLNSQCFMDNDDQKEELFVWLSRKIRDK